METGQKLKFSPLPFPLGQVFFKLLMVFQLEVFFCFPFSYTVYSICFFVDRIFDLFHTVNCQWIDPCHEEQQESPEEGKTLHWNKDWVAMLTRSLRSWVEFFLDKNMLPDHQMNILFVAFWSRHNKNQGPCFLDGQLDLIPFNSISLKHT